jgi:hypothetical protein
MSGFVVNQELADELAEQFDSSDQAQLSRDIAEEAERVRLQGVTGSRLTPVERITEFASNPMQNVVEPASAFVTDIGSGAITGLAGIGQLSAEVQQSGQQFLDYLVGEEYTDAEREEFVQRHVTDPELARQKAYADYRLKVSGKEPSPIAGFIGEVLPTLVANPKKAAEGAFGRFVQSVVYGGVSGAMEFAEGGVNDRAMNTLIGATSGGLLDTAGQLLRLGKRTVGEALNPRMTDFVQTDKVDIGARLSTKEVSEVIEAARALNITVTPAEASGDVLLVHGQNTLNVNEASRESLSEFLNARNDSLTENILSLQRVSDRDLQYTGATFSPATGERPKAPFIGRSDEVKWKQTRNDVYKQTLEPNELKAILGSSPMLQQVHNTYVKALKKPAAKRTNEDVLAITAFNKLKTTLGISGDMPLNNVGYLDLLIKNLDTLLENGLGTGANVVSVRDQRKALSGVLKRNVDGYGDFKALEQRRLAVNNLQNAVDTSVVADKDYAEAFYNNVLKNKDKREELLRQLETDPLAKKKVEDLTLVMSHIFSDSSLSKLIKSDGIDIIQQGGGGFGQKSALILKFRELIRNDAGLINVITNPQWTSDISRLKGRTSDETLQNTTAFLSRVINTSDKIETALGVKQQTRQEMIDQMISKQ